MPANSGAWSILDYEYVLKRCGLEPCELCSPRAQGKKKLRDISRFSQPLTGEVVMPAKGDHAALPKVAVKLEFPKRQLAHAVQQCVLSRWVDQFGAVMKTFKHRMLAFSCGLEEVELQRQYYRPLAFD